MTTGWLLLLLVVSSQSVDSQSTTDDEVCDGQQSTEMKKDIQRILANQQQLFQQHETIMKRLDITATKSDVEHMKTVQRTLLDNQQILQSLHDNRTTINHLDIAAIKNAVEQLTRHVQTLLDNQQPVLQLLQSNLTAMNRLDIAAIKSTVEQLTRHVETLLDNQQPVLQFLQSNLTAMNRLDITAIKSDLEQLSEVKTDMKTLLENQQPILQLLQSNLTAMSRLDIAAIKSDVEQLNDMRRGIQTLLDNQQLLQSLHENQTKLLVKLRATTAKPRDCSEIYKSGERSDDVYTVYVGRAKSPVKVYCDMTTAGGGWTVFQRRQDGSVDFYRNWAEYRTGFGNPYGEFWLGNDNLHLLTSSNIRQRLRVDLADWEGNTTYAEYDNFTVASEREKYRLESLGTYNGTAGDSLSEDHLGYKFSTRDQDNDAWSSGSCAVRFKGAWWYDGSYCYRSNLNGLYYHSGSYTSSYSDGVVWYDWKLTWLYSLKITEMKIRPF